VSGHNVTKAEPGPRRQHRRSGRAVAFIRAAEQRTDPSGREIAADIALALAATVALAVVMASTVKLQVQCGTDGATLAPGAGSSCLGPGIGWQTALPLTAAAWPLAMLRFRPLTTLWLSLPGALIASHDANAVILIAVVLAAYSATVHSPYRRATMLSVAAAGILIAVAFQHTPVAGREAALLAPIPLLVVGNAMHHWRRRAGDSQARLLRVQAEHETATRQALEHERARIARELHDVVTSNVSVMIVQAGAARHVLSSSPDQAREALLAVEDSGRSAMSELHHLLGLLSPPDAPADGAWLDEAGADAGGISVDTDLRPQPGLEQLQALIDRVAAAGLPIERHIASLPPGLPPGADLTAFRIIQEALTNVIKHAGKPQTSVRLDYREGDLVVEVADAGRPVPVTGPAVPGTGRGLLGLRERTALYGGKLEAHPRPGGGWLVRARIPVAPAPATTPGPGPAAFASPAVPGSAAQTAPRR
jgi:signal transduction histidine kinase